MQLPTSMKKLLLWGFKMLKTENTKICPESYFPNVEVTAWQWNKSLGGKVYCKCDITCHTSLFLWQNFLPSLWLCCYMHLYLHC